jgi:hypothetical protein
MAAFALAGAGVAEAEEPAERTAQAQAPSGYKTATRLGGPTSFYGPVRDMAGLARMANNARVQRDIRTVLAEVGLSAKADEVIRLMANGEGVAEVSVPVGQTWEWMALKRGSRPAVVRQVRWGGKEPFGAFQFVIDDLDRTYVFIVAKPCGNIALLVNEPSREKARRDAEEKARLEKERLAKEEADRRAKEEAERKAREEAERKAREEAERKAREEAERRAREEAERRAQEEAERARLEALRRDKVNFFVEGVVGKERRVRDVSDIRGLPTEFLDGRCAPLFGVKAGPDIRLSPTWRFAPGIGVAVNTRDSGNTSAFAEIEFNRWFEKGYVGSGVGVWDFTHSDTVAPTWLFGFGAELYRNSADTGRLFFVGQGRLFFDEFDDIENNYQFWGGLRYIWR